MQARVEERFPDPERHDAVEQYIVVIDETGLGWVLGLAPSSFHPGREEFMKKVSQRINAGGGGAAAAWQGLVGRYVTTSRPSTPEEIEMGNGPTFGGAGLVIEVVEGPAGEVGVVMDYGFAWGIDDQTDIHASAVGSETARNISEAMQEGPPAGPGVVGDDILPFAPAAIRRYLDRAITTWREKRDALPDGHVDTDVARAYVDAFQSVRSSIFGETLS
jgi:hypothetical protein